MVTKVEIPSTAESVSEVNIVEWLKSDGEWVNQDEPVCVLETDKADVELPSPASGVLSIDKQEGSSAAVGEAIGTIDEGGEAEEKPAKAEPETKTGKEPPNEEEIEEEPPKEESPKEDEEEEPELSPAVRRLVQENNLDPNQIKGTGKGGRIVKEDVLHYLDQQKPDDKQAEKPHPKEKPEEKTAKPEETLGRTVSPEPQGKAVPRPTVAIHGEEKERARFRAEETAEDDSERVPMSKIRRRIADNLVKSQQTAAMLTTFNEIDMSSVLSLRERYRDRFDEVHGVKLGFMSFFAKACSMALKEFRELNASIDGHDIVYHNHVHLGIAVSTERGLVVPVVQNIDEITLAKIELEIKRLASNARAGRLGMKELSGATFTITNGGIYGSLLSTPILNLPQSGILGMHAIKKRPIVAEDDKIEVRPMMNVALTYDHRLVDGSVSVSFLVRIKQYLEDPARLLLEI